MFYPPVVPDLRIEEHGRIGELARGSDSSRDRGRRSRSSSRSRSRGRECRRRSSSRSLSSRVRSRSSDRSRSRRVRSRSQGDQSRSSDRYRPSPRPLSALDWSAVLLTATDHVDTVRVPQLAGEITVDPAGEITVTARGHAVDYLPPLIVRDQGRKDGEPDEISRGVWRR